MLPNECDWSVYLPGVCFLTNTHTVYESDKQTDDAGCQDDNADVPKKTHYLLLTD